MGWHHNHNKRAHEELVILNATLCIFDSVIEKLQKSMTDCLVLVPKKLSEMSIIQYIYAY